MRDYNGWVLLGVSFTAKYGGFPISSQHVSGSSPHPTLSQIGRGESFLRSKPSCRGEGWMLLHIQPVCERISPHPTSVCQRTGVAAPSPNLGEGKVRFAIKPSCRGEGGFCCISEVVLSRRIFSPTLPSPSWFGRPHQDREGAEFTAPKIRLCRTHNYCRIYAWEPPQHGKPLQKLISAG